MIYNNKKSRFIFIIIPIILTLFLWSFGIPIGKTVIPISLILSYILLGILAIKNLKLLMTHFKFATKHLPLKYLILFILWGIVSAAIGGEHSKVLLFSGRIIRDFGLFVIPFFFTALIIANKLVSYKKMLNIFIISYFVVLIFGIIKYVIGIFSPTLHSLIHTMITSGITSDDQLGRASSIFTEPSFFATFLFVSMPMILKISGSKFVILNNRYISKIAKKLLVLLLYINLLLSQSPIYIVLGLIYTLFYFKKETFRFFVKYFIFAFIVLTTLCYGIYFFINTAQDNKVVVRLIKTFSSINSISALIEAEPSLGTRLSLIINTIDICKQHPIVGYGYANTKKAMYNQLHRSRVPITYEIAVENEKLGGLTVASLFFQQLSWVGIPGVILLYLFFIATLVRAIKYEKFFTGREKLFISGIRLSAINYLICSFYWLLIAEAPLWFYFGILNSVIFNGMNMRAKISFSNIVKIQKKEVLN